MSVFHQLKNIFRNHVDNNNKTNKYEAAVTKIVKEENLAKSKVPEYEGLEGFTLLNKLGEGAFSNVYKAIDKKTGQHVAIKIVRKFELSQIQVNFFLSFC
ncbi:hypothetical protein BDF21DRAFT_340592 [Thamnidium elegans]|uniref:Protein kinase domain-containing protein n=1 Tax=Thamnidium elegans TaxID=101142 RepID=A0A8H7SPK0_9FUNG|nr:hypothetical protein INT48_005291 [Thamnidium elegans]KAI8079335.1 hypothetical protein BDF21DRAFT_340592 [Thamnidium elegans]